MKVLAGLCVSTCIALFWLYYTQSMVKTMDQAAQDTQIESPKAPDTPHPTAQATAPPPTPPATEAPEAEAEIIMVDARPPEAPPTTETQAGADAPQEQAAPPPVEPETTAAAAPAIAQEETETTPEASIHPPSEFDTTLEGQIYAYRINVPPGWSRVDGTGDRALTLNSEIDVVVNAHYAGLDNNAWAREAFAQTKANTPGITLHKQSMVIMDGRHWARFDFLFDDGYQLILFTHGSDRGRYDIHVSGSADALLKHQTALNDLLARFRFPPDNISTDAPIADQPPA